MTCFINMLDMVVFLKKLNEKIIKRNEEKYSLDFKFSYERDKQAPNSFIKYINELEQTMKKKDINDKEILYLLVDCKVGPIYDMNTFFAYLIKDIEYVQSKLKSKIT